MSELKEVLLRVLESTQAPRRRMPGELNPDDFADAEQYQKAVGPSVAILDKREYGRQR